MMEDRPDRTFCMFIFRNNTPPLFARPALSAAYAIAMRPCQRHQYKLRAKRTLPAPCSPQLLKSSGYAPHADGLPHLLSVSFHFSCKALIHYFSHT
jgi:hypothetical protein